MTTVSPRLGLVLPTTADHFSTADYKGNFDKVDAAPGTYICTSSTRPTGWGAGQTGRRILETNTGVEYRWSGTAWIRLTGASGILKTSGGGFAIDERSTDFSTSSSTFVRVLTVQNVVVPAGNRPLMLVANWYQADNNAGTVYAAIFRSASNDSGPQMSRIIIPPNLNGKGPGASHVAFERGGLNAGTYDFSLQIRSGPQGGTSWMYGDATQPIQLTVIEI